MSGIRGRPFQPGNQFGHGRPAGSRNKATMALQDVLGEHAEALLKKCVLMAMQGDTAALRLCMERLLPPRRQSPIQFKLPAIATAADVNDAVGTLVQAVARGQLTPTDGQVIAGVLEVRRRSIETAELEARLRALEQDLREKGPEK